MIIITTTTLLRERITAAGLHPVGLVPTMGALHEGHMSLVKSAVAQCPLVVVSIYVNPAQFNDKEDLRNYPRPKEKDLEMLKKVLRPDDAVFTPDDREIYPSEDKRLFNFGNLDKVMEAVHRPGHFNGVARVVTRLFDIVDPDTAFFGQKDFQQVAVIKELVKQKKYSIEIRVHPIVREKDGLAMSSRNMLLEPEDRKKASVIFRTISEASAMIRNKDIPEIKEYVYSAISKKAGFRVEYFEVVDEISLLPLAGRDEMNKDTRYFGCIAVKAGKIRLIDNIEFPLE